MKIGMQMHICNPSPPEIQEAQHESRARLDSTAPDQPGLDSERVSKSQDQAEQLSSITYNTITTLSTLGGCGGSAEVLWLLRLFLFTFLFIHVFCVYIHLGIYVSVLPSVSQGSNLGH